MFVILQKERFIAENDLKRDESLQKGLHQQFPKSIAQSIVDPINFLWHKDEGRNVPFVRLPSDSLPSFTYHHEGKNGKL